MFTKGKVTTIIILVLIVIVGGFLWYRSYSAKKNAENIQATGDISSFENAVDENGNNIAIPEGDNLDEEMQDFNAQCEAGEWLKIADQSGEQATMSGKLRRVYPDDETSKDFSGYSYFLEGTAKIALTGSNLDKLYYFAARDKEVQGG